MKHTKAPWYAIEFAGYWEIQNDEKYEDNRLLDEASCPNAEANAKLAAAPELLAAMQYYFDVLDEVRGEGWDLKPDHVLAKMIAAVKKAIL